MCQVSGNFFYHLHWPNCIASRQKMKWTQIRCSKKKYFHPQKKWRLHWETTETKEFTFKYDIIRLCLGWGWERKGLLTTESNWSSLGLCIPYSSCFAGLLPAGSSPLWLCVYNLHFGRILFSFVFCIVCKCPPLGSQSLLVLFCNTSFPPPPHILSPVSIHIIPTTKQGKEV